MKQFLIVCLGCALLGLLGCSDYDKSSDGKLQKQTEESMKEANAQVGMPAIKNFQERKLAKMIFELRDQEKLVCYAYLVSLEGKLIFIGKCLGFGLPYSIQYTNPEKVIRHGSTTQYGTLPQPDPNGLFMPSGLSATWLMMLDKDGNPHPVYCEPQIIVSPFPLTE
ncbi:hypothetical protein LCGC14_1149570 [marine sediment metagenome]|uniref:Uncharacterized protein n=1 Tax=marine sediment metagenome TaxID=412755 RepID=A0A0F9M0X1_9ZZZZ|nr:hypothetical protein [Pricia sp.]